MRVMGWLVLLFGVTTLSLVGQEAAEGDAAVTIRALEHEWIEGQSRNDNAALNLIFDNALVYVEYGRLVTKGEYLIRIKREPPQLDQIVTEPITVRTFGNTAIVVGSYREKPKNGGRGAVKRWRFIDTWVHEENGWVLVAAAAAPVSK